MKYVLITNKYYNTFCLNGDADGLQKCSIIICRGWYNKRGRISAVKKLSSLNMIVIIAIPFFK